MHLTRPKPALLWRSDVQQQLDRLRRQVALKELQCREALEALEHVCDQRDEARMAAQGARADANYFMKLARSEAERADQAQPLTANENRWWTLVGCLFLIGWGVAIGYGAFAP